MSQSLSQAGQLFEELQGWKDRGEELERLMQEAEREIQGLGEENKALDAKAREYRNSNDDLIEKY